MWSCRVGPCAVCGFEAHGSGRSPNRQSGVSNWRQVASAWVVAVLVVYGKPALPVEAAPASGCMPRQCKAASLSASCPHGPFRRCAASPWSCQFFFLNSSVKRFRLSGCSSTKESMWRIRFCSRISSTAIRMPVSSTSPNSWFTAVPNMRMVGLSPM